MLKLKTATPRWIIIVIDLFVSIFSLLLAYFIRFDLNTNLYAMKNEWLLHWPEFLTYLLIKGLVFYAFGIHKGLVRYTSIQDSQRILKANLTATTLFIIISAVRSITWGYHVLISELHTTNGVYYQFNVFNWKPLCY